MFRFVHILCMLAVILSVYPSETVNASTATPKIDKVIVIKSKRLLMLMGNGRIVRSYRVALGKQPAGTKVRAGDQKTPEGSYTLVSRNPKSKFFRSMKISYPNDSDVQHAKAIGASPGGEIMIHGLPNGLGEIGKFHRRWDWTDGCIAVTNYEMDEIWQLVPDGTPIEIKP